MHQNFKKTDKQNRIEWGKPSQYPQYSHVVLAPPNQSSGIDKKSGDGREADKKVDLKNLSIQESQIINSQLRETVFSRHEPKDKISHSQYNKETVQRLNQIKNQFEILKGMMIDSRIVQKTNKESRENYSNLSLSSSGAISHSKQSHLKIGEAVRTKDRNRNRKSHQASSSSASNKDLKSRKSQANDFHEPHSRASQFLDHEKSRHSKMSKSKNSKQHHSHSIKGEKSKSGERGSNRYDVPKLGGFFSTSALEKQSLELQLRSALQKVQVLIQNEIVLKTKNHELEQAIRRHKSESDNKSYQKQEKKIQDLQNTIKSHEASLGREKEAHLELLQKLGKLEAESVAHEAIVSMLKQEKNKEASLTMSMKLEVANLQIDIKRIQMEKDIDLRERDYEIARLRKQNERMRLEGYGGKSGDGVLSSHEKERVNFLQRQLQERDRKYRQLVSEVENKKYLKQQAELLGLVEKIHRSKGNENESIIKQVERLKNQISKIKTNQDLTHSQFGFESKVLSLENALKKDGEQKSKYMNEVEKFQREHEELRRKYKELKMESESEIEDLSRKNLQLKSALDDRQSYRQRYSQLIQKVEELEAIIKNYEQIETQVRQLRNELRQKESAYNSEIKQAQRKVDLAQFEIFKTQKSSQFNLDISSRKIASEMEILRGQAKAIENERNYYYDQLNSLKNEYQDLRLKMRDIELSNHQNTLHETQLQFEDKQRIRKEYEGEMYLLNQRFLKQQERLVERVTILTNANQELAEVQRVNFILQSQNEQLRKLCRNKISTSENIMHLWEIKQVQYGNVHSILKEITPATARIDSTPRTSRVQSIRNAETHKINLHSPNAQSLPSLEQKRSSRIQDKSRTLQRYNSSDSHSQMML